MRGCEREWKREYCVRELDVTENPCDFIKRTDFLFFFCFHKHHKIFAKLNKREIPQQNSGFDI